MDTTKLVDKVLLNQATKDAVLAHEGQYYGEEPYIYHPIRVASNFQENNDLRIIALLHDALEDNYAVMQYLITKERYPKVIVDTVEILTRNEGVSYEEYIKLIKTDSYAIRVKLADLQDNMSAYLRLNDKKSNDYARFDKYRKAYWELKAALNKPSIEQIFASTVTTPLF